MLREPASWFQSHYYFERFGWRRKTDSRVSFSGSEADRSRSINTCVQEQHYECKNSRYPYIEFICGNDCLEARSIKNNGLITDPVIVAKMTVMLRKVKKLLLENYFVVGIMEDFETSLRLFEAMMPEVFSGAIEANRSPEVAAARNATMTETGERLTERNMEVLRGVFKWE